jgi:hypothetical protein
MEMKKPMGVKVILQTRTRRADFLLPLEYAQIVTP